MLISIYLLLLANVNYAESSSLRGRIIKNDLVPFSSSKGDVSKKESNSLKIISNEPFIIQLGTTNASSENRKTKPSLLNGKNKKPKRTSKKRLSKLKAFRKRHRIRRDVSDSGLKAFIQNAEKTLASRVQPLKGVINGNHSKYVYQKEIGGKVVNWRDLLEPKSEALRSPKNRFEEGVKSNSSSFDLNKTGIKGNIKRKFNLNLKPLTLPNPIARKMKSPTVRVEKTSSKISDADLTLNLERIGKKINDVRKLLKADDSDYSEDGVRVRRKTEADRAVDKIAKMFLTLSAMNGYHERRKPRCKDNIIDYSDGESDAEESSMVTKKNPSYNEERYKVKKWIEDLKSKRSNRYCPCNQYKNDDEAFPPLERKISKDYYMEDGSSEEIYDDGNKKSKPFFQKHNFNLRNKNLKDGYLKSKYAKVSNADVLKAIRDRRKLELPIEDLELYRTRAKKILQNAEEILDKIKEEEEKRNSKSGYLSPPLKDLKSKLQPNLENNGNNEFIKLLQKNIGLDALRKTHVEEDEKSFKESIKSYFLDPYEKARQLKEESAKKLSAFLLQNFANLAKSIDDKNNKSEIDPGKEIPLQTLQENIPSKTELLQVDNLKKEIQDDSGDSSTIKIDSEKNNSPKDQTTKNKEKMLENPSIEGPLKKIVDDMLKEQEEHKKKYSGKMDDENIFTEVNEGSKMITSNNEEKGDKKIDNSDVTNKGKSFYPFSGVYESLEKTKSMDESRSADEDKKSQNLKESIQKINIDEGFKKLTTKDDGVSENVEETGNDFKFVEESNKLYQKPNEENEKFYEINEGKSLIDEENSKSDGNQNYKSEKYETNPDDKVSMVNEASKKEMMESSTNINDEIYENNESQGNKNFESFNEKKPDIVDNGVVQLEINEKRNEEGIKENVNEALKSEELNESNGFEEVQLSKKENDNPKENKKLQENPSDLENVQETMKKSDTSEDFREKITDDEKDSIFFEDNVQKTKDNKKDVNAEESTENGQNNDYKIKNKSKLKNKSDENDTSETEDTKENNESSSSEEQVQKNIKVSGENSDSEEKEIESKNGENLQKIGDKENAAVLTENEENQENNLNTKKIIDKVNDEEQNFPTKSNTGNLNLEENIQQIKNMEDEESNDTNMEENTENKPSIDKSIQQTSGIEQDDPNHKIENVQESYDEQIKETLNKANNYKFKDGENEDIGSDKENIQQIKEAEEGKESDINYQEENVQQFNNAEKEDAVSYKDSVQQSNNLENEENETDFTENLQQIKEAEGKENDDSYKENNVQQINNVKEGGTSYEEDKVQQINNVEEEAGNNNYKEENVQQTNDFENIEENAYQINNGKGEEGDISYEDSKVQQINDAELKDDAIYKETNEQQIKEAEGKESDTNDEDENVQQINNVEEEAGDANYKEESVQQTSDLENNDATYKEDNLQQINNLNEGTDTSYEEDNLQQINNLNEGTDTSYEEDKLKQIKDENHTNIKENEEGGTSYEEKTQIINNSENESNGSYEEESVKKIKESEKDLVSYKENPQRDLQDEREAEYKEIDLSQIKNTKPKAKQDQISEADEKYLGNEEEENVGQVIEDNKETDFPDTKTYKTGEESSELNEKLGSTTANNEREEESRENKEYFENEGLDNQNIQKIKMEDNVNNNEMNESDYVNKKKEIDSDIGDSIRQEISTENIKQSPEEEEIIQKIKDVLEENDLKKSESSEANLNEENESPPKVDYNKEEINMEENEIKEINKKNFSTEGEDDNVKQIKGEENENEMKDVSEMNENDEENEKVEKTYKKDNFMNNYSDENMEIENEISSSKELHKGDDDALTSKLFKQRNKATPFIPKKEKEVEESNLYMNNLKDQTNLDDDDNDDLNEVDGNLEKILQKTMVPGKNVDSGNYKDIDENNNFPVSNEIIDNPESNKNFENPDDLFGDTNTQVVDYSKDWLSDSTPKQKNINAEEKNFAGDDPAYSKDNLPIYNAKNTQYNEEDEVRRENVAKVREMEGDTEKKFDHKMNENEGLLKSDYGEQNPESSESDEIDRKKTIDNIDEKVQMKAMDPSTIHGNKINEEEILENTLKENFEPEIPRVKSYGDGIWGRQRYVDEPMEYYDDLTESESSYKSSKSSEENRFPLLLKKEKMISSTHQPFLNEKFLSGANKHKARQTVLPEKIEKIIKDLNDNKGDGNIDGIDDLNAEEIDHFIDQINKAESENSNLNEETDCKKQCSCAEEIDLRSRKIGRYEIVKDFLHWMKDLRINRVLSDD